MPERLLPLNKRLTGIFVQYARTMCGVRFRSILVAVLAVTLAAALAPLTFAQQPASAGTGKLAAITVSGSPVGSSVIYPKDPKRRLEIWWQNLIR